MMTLRLGALRFPFVAHFLLAGKQPKNPTPTGPNGRPTLNRANKPQKGVGVSGGQVRSGPQPGQGGDAGTD